MDAPTDVSVVEEATAEGIPQPKAWLSALNRRRWETFKANRRGYWSLWIFLVLFAISMCAEFIANDKPILVDYEGQLLLARSSRPIRRRSSAASSRRKPTIAIPWCRS